MRCFVHREIDAVAVCKSCGKGACPGCAVSATGGVVCSERCGAELTRLNAYVRGAGQRTRAVHTTQAVMFLVLALCTGLAALVAEDVGRWVMAGATLLLVLGALRFFRLAAAWRDPPASYGSTIDSNPSAKS